MMRFVEDDHERGDQQQADDEFVPGRQPFGFGRFVTEHSGSDSLWHGIPVKMDGSRSHRTRPTP